MSAPAATIPPPSPPTAAAKAASFSAALDIVKLFTTLSSGALAFSIGLTAQATDNYPPLARFVILVAMVIFFVSIVAGIWAQGMAPGLLLHDRAEPNTGSFRTIAAVAVLSFALGVAVLAGVLLFTALLFGAAGQRLAVASPTAALAKALTVVDAARVSKVAATELLHGVDPVRPDRAAWHVQLELEPAKRGGAARTVDVYVDPVHGCATAVQPGARPTSLPACLGLPTPSSR